MQAALPRQFRANQSPIHSLQRSLVLPRRIGNQHPASTDYGGTNRALLNTRCASFDRFTIPHLN